MFTKADIQDPVQHILYFPMTAYYRQYLFRLPTSAFAVGGCVPGFNWPFTGINLGPYDPQPCSAGYANAFLSYASMIRRLTLKTV